MYGIMTSDGDRVVCVRTESGVGEAHYTLKRWDREAIPLMKSSVEDLTDLLALFSDVWLRADLVIFTFTKDQEQRILMKKLTGNHCPLLFRAPSMV